MVGLITSASFLKDWFVALTFNQALLVLALATIGYIVKHFVSYIQKRDDRDIEIKKEDMAERAKTIEAGNIAYIKPSSIR